MDYYKFYIDDCQYLSSYSEQTIKDKWNEMLSIPLREEFGVEIYNEEEVLIMDPTSCFLTEEEWGSLIEHPEKLFTFLQTIMKPKCVCEVTFYNINDSTDVEHTLIWHITKNGVKKMHDMWHNPDNDEEEIDEDDENYWDEEDE